MMDKTKAFISFSSRIHGTEKEPTTQVYKRTHKATKTSSRMIPRIKNMVHNERTWSASWSRICSPSTQLFCLPPFSLLWNISFLKPLSAQLFLVREHVTTVHQPPWPTIPLATCPCMLIFKAWRGPPSHFKKTTPPGDLQKGVYNMLFKKFN